MIRSERISKKVAMTDHFTKGSEEVRAWCERFFRWYNKEHHHRSLGYVTPSHRHAGIDTTVLAERAAVQAQCLAERRAYNTQNLAAIPAVAATSVA